ncbi:hypothetical protein JYK02_38215 [Corallococcus macrosporus]|uniref:Uncharacterized protein n=1 Tax=Corallococcus macrosporus TaxID=35 RepID=A0ABS3DPV7_9BACT|nr:DUF6714 family protein [Corallococcus macrosporus]MBN8233369.1 hypothetical protein [Corallococcus macrosporus]
MSSPSDSARDLAALARVRQAFAATPPPPASVGRPGLWFDEHGAPHTYDDPESEEAAGHFAGRPWTDFANAALLQWESTQSGLLHLSSQGRAYYLPAYLIALLTEVLDVDTFSALETVVDVLMPPDPRAPRSVPGGQGEAQWKALVQARITAFQDFVAALDGPQRAAVAAFLDAMVPRFGNTPPPNPARVALDEFWATWLPALSGV